eukprot:4121577-Pyramimonas_sp.AAC.1
MSDSVPVPLAPSRLNPPTFLHPRVPECTGHRGNSSYELLPVVLPVPSIEGLGRGRPGFVRRECGCG